MFERYDRDGCLIDEERYMELLHLGAAYKQVARTEVVGYKVSTVWLGFDHGRGPGAPVIFETMIFGAGPLDQYQERYTSEADARAGHERIVAMCAEAGGA